MCGIVGICGKEQLQDEEVFRLMRDALRHRGPDDAGFWKSPDGVVMLGHRRLSIIDLSPAGHQPMQDVSGNLSIVFNGEIYNYVDLRRELAAKGHTFHSHSDTEVILVAYHEWNTDCISHLNGMFAFALYDSRCRQLFMARDRAGEKPLFYEVTGGGVLRLASELKSLMSDPAMLRRVDAEALDCYLAMGYVPGSRCMLRDVKKLPPAHALVFDLNNRQIRLWRYWQLPEMDASAIAGLTDEEELLDELEALLEDAVRRQLVADVPVGVLLSGGLDSSLVTAMAVRTTSKIKTFTIRFPGYGALDETEYARLISRHFGTEHVELSASEATLELLPMLARQFDEPLADSSIIPTYLVSHLVRGHCTVVIGGDGGDELFGGYHHYHRLLWMQQRLGSIPRSLRWFSAKVAEHMLPLGFGNNNIRTWLMAAGSDFSTELPLTSAFFDRTTRRKLMAGQIGWQLVAEHIRQQRIPRFADLVQRATRMDVENYLAEDILVKVDRASMLTSLEVRAPMLDYRLIEFSFGKVPSHLKATATRRKVLLKKLADRLLPSEFDQHRKQGFTIPLDSWLKLPAWQTFFREVLLDSDSAIFNPKLVSNLLDGQVKGRANRERLFALVMFELWRQEYKISM